MTLTPLRDPHSLNSLAYRQIKDAILTFKFQPGQALIEGELASQLGISKTPVRDALLQLEQDGLVTRVPFRGTYVSEISNTDMVNTYRIRVVLEGLAVRLAIGSLTKADFERLKMLIETHLQALNRADFVEATRKNHEFHSTLINHCGNPRLIKLLNLLDDHLERYRLLSVSQGIRKDKSIEEHQQVYAAVISRDPDQAEGAMRFHLESAIEDLVKQDFDDLWRSLKFTT